MGQETFRTVVRHLGNKRQLQITRRDLDAEALRWAQNRGARSGRVARQFVDDLHGRLALQEVARRSEH